MNWEINVKKGEHHYYLRSSDTSSDKWVFWLENEHNEGTSMSAIDLFDVLDKFFKENF